MKCPNCNINPAQIDKQLGILYCKKCQNRLSKVAKPDSQIEYTSEEIKEGRRQSFKSIIQRYRDGQLSKEFCEAYPERVDAMIKEGIHTKKEIKQAKNVWSDVFRGDWRRTK